MRISSFLVRDKKIRRKIKSDPQRHLVYSMERNYLVGMCINTGS